MNKKYLAIGILAAVIIVLTIALLVQVTRIPSHGTVKTIGVRFFWDHNCTSEVTQIDWDSVYTGGSYAVITYAKNTQTVNVTLAMNVTEWTPTSAATYLHTEWNYSGQILKPGQILTVRFLLTVSPDTQGITTFSYVYTITATEKKN